MDNDKTKYIETNKCDSFEFQFDILRAEYNEICDDHKKIEQKSSWLLTLESALAVFIMYTSIMNDKSLIRCIVSNSELNAKMLFYIFSNMTIIVALVFIIKVFMIKDYKVITEELYSKPKPDVILNKLSTYNDDNRRTSDYKAQDFQISLISFIISLLATYIYIML